MGIAVIGGTGFVGGYLASHRQVEATYSSRDSASMAGREHSLVVCAGASAVKWKANADGKGDWSAIEALWRNVSRVKADRFVLISTVDVYPNPIGVYESSKPHCLPNHSYGINRLALEELVLDRFGSAARVLRLPGLFGQGLRKNILFDMVHQRLLDTVDERSSFQWYGLSRLWGDIDRALEHPSERVFNLAVEPLRTSLIRDELFPGLVLSGRNGAGSPAAYDMRTSMCSWMGGSWGYLEGADAVLSRMRSWLAGPQPVLGVIP